MTETKVTYLGTVDADGIGLFDIPLDRPVDEIRAAIERANAEREAEKQRELLAVHRLFLGDGTKPLEPPPEEKPPVERDWLIP